MNIVEAKDAIFLEKPEGDRVHYYLFDDYEVIHVDQPPHSEQVRHHHEKIWETVYIVEGEFRVLWTEGGVEKSKIVRAGDLLETEQSSHAFRNETDKVARMVAIKHIRSDTNYREVFKNDKIVG